jgi:class 3 adenylate cyclase
MNQVAARNQISYEVYVKDRSGRWQIHAHFSGAQKKQAEEEAKQIERAAHVSAVKVIREVYNHGTNSSDDYVIYETRDKGGKASPDKQAKAPAPKPAAKPAAFEQPVANCAPKAQKPAPAKKPVVRHNSTESGEHGLIGLILKMAIAFCVSIAIGLAAMLAAAKGLEYLPSMGVTISQGFYDKANFVSFTVGFLASVVPMLMSVTKKYKGNGRNPSSARTSQPNQRSVKAAQSRGHGSFGGYNSSEMSGSKKSAAELAAEISENDVPQDRENTNAASPEDNVDGNENAQSDDIPDAPLVETPDMRKTRDKMKAFISGSMRAIRKNVPNLDAYHKFGVNLYVAGACDACSEKNALQQKDGRAVLRDCITALGANKGMADTFCKNVDNYILEPKYKDMYGAGRQSMASYIEDETSINVSVSKALESWSEKPAAGPQGTAGKKLHALMFTDIVNSTQKTQELGDHGAQQMVHIHNQIVRTALINNYGKEVKHMGDGIMAVFPSSASSVEAAIEIQKNMASHNASQDLKFQIRIGINSGEAIAEENDLFGTVVQLAARVCAQAGGDEILVSQNTKNTYAGSRANFTSQGTRTMKGFAEPIEVFSATSRV